MTKARHNQNVYDPTQNHHCNTSAKNHLTTKATRKSSYGNGNSIHQHLTQTNSHQQLQIVSSSTYTGRNHIKWGREILKTAYNGTTDSNDKPMLHKFTQSKIKWPTQTRPPHIAWRIWQKWLRTLMRNKCLSPKRTLLGWNQHKNRFRQWTNDTKNYNEVNEKTTKDNDMRQNRWNKKTITENQIIQSKNITIVTGSNQTQSKCTY
jgi:hypothetical protein